MADLKTLVAAVRDEDSLVALLNEGLGWPTAPEFAFDQIPEIADGVPGEGKVRVSRLIPASHDDERLILLAEFDRPYVRRDLRELLTSLKHFVRSSGKFEGITGLGDTIFIVTTPSPTGRGSQGERAETPPFRSGLDAAVTPPLRSGGEGAGGWGDIRFVRFEEQGKRQPSIRSFGWRKEFVGRTVLTHNLERMKWEDRASWEKAWDVDGLTEEFYKDFERVFKSVRAQVTGAETPDKAHEWTQLLFNRLLFIAFIQRMGWLRAPGKPVGAYLHDLLAGERGPFRTFLGEIRALITELDTEPDKAEKGQFRVVLGDVPYLNGGLFAPDPIDTPGIDLPDVAFEDVLGEPNGLFSRYNFTVTESTPLDQEVAVDPEMLGKIFERLVNDRHDEGKYYTPRPIVSFMVDEAIKGYLVERGVCTQEQAELLVDRGLLKDKETGVHLDADDVKPVRDALKAVRAVDPACGSGAYLLGLLQKLFDLVDLLNLHDKTPRELYDLKLRLLQTCIYGVDLDPVAVRIARLRLWLSLVVENRLDKQPDGTVVPPQPLPNLDFKIERGDSLAVPVTPLQPDIFRVERIREFESLKTQFSSASSDKREALRSKILDLRNEIRQWQAHSSVLMTQSKAPFDWMVEFAEVFEPEPNGRGGFDIILANPPYVRGDTLGEMRFSLRDAFPQVSHGKADLYVYFFARTLELLAPRGQLVFITPNRWFQAEYGKKLRVALQTQTAIRFLVDFEDKAVFPGVSTYPLITVAAKGLDAIDPRYAVIKTLDPPYPDVQLLISEIAASASLPAAPGGAWTLRAKPEGSGKTVSLLQYTNGELFLGMKTGFNPAFFLTRQQAQTFRDNGEAPHLRPLLRGRDLDRWIQRGTSNEIIYVHGLETLQKAPRIKAHLEQYRDQLERRDNRGKEYWQFRGGRIYELFSGPKIVFPDIAKRNVFALVRDDAVVDTSCFFIPTDDLYLLGVLNSAPMLAKFDGIGVKMRGGFYRFNKRYSEQIPIPIPSDADRAAIEAIVQQILDLKAANPAADVSALESEIDARVEFLYFHQDKAPTYDDYQSQLAAEAGTLTAEVRALIAAGENSKVEFKQSLEYVDPQHPEILKAPEGTPRQQKLRAAMDAVLHSALKSICAFLNSQGGTLLIGVHDKNGPVGIGPDIAMIAKEKDRDKDGFERKLRELMYPADPNAPKGRFNRSPAFPNGNRVEIDFPVGDGKQICRVVVTPSSEPFYLDGEFFIRDGNRTIVLTDHQRDEYIAQRRAAG